MKRIFKKYDHHLAFFYTVFFFDCNLFCRDIKAIVEGTPYLLIESVAENIAQKILKTHASVDSVCVRIEKPHVAVEGVVEALGVEITRSKE